MAPTICVPGIHEVATDFDVHSDTISTLAITLYSLGLALGPMFISPLSETYGRLPVYHVTNTVFLVFLVATALSRTISQFIVFRVLSGLVGGTPMALGGGTIADVTVPQDRAIAMALFSLGPLAGPVSSNPVTSQDRSHVRLLVFLLSLVRRLLIFCLLVSHRSWVQ